MYTFYSEGFFGYGEKGDFTYFSLWHFLPIVLLAAAILLVYRYREQLRTWKWEGRARFLYAFVMLLAEMSYFWRLVYVGDETGAYNMLGKLPLQVCQWGLICSVFALMSKNDLLFNINFYISISFATLALITPAVIVRAGPTYFRYYQFWMEHEMPILAAFYMMFVHQKKLRYRYLWVTWGLLFLMGLLCAYVNNHIPGAEYMYLVSDPEERIGTSIADLMPRTQSVRFVVFGVVAAALFHLEYFIWKKAHREE